MIGIELAWFRCADGTEIHDYGNAVQRVEKTVKLGGDTRSGLYVRWRSQEQRPYDKRIADLKDPMVERFIRCDTPEDFVTFTSEYGMPGANDQDQMRETSIKGLKASRDNLQKLFDLNAAGKTTEALKIYNKNSIPLTPRMVSWPSAATPVMVFQTKNPYGFMLMEAALAVGNATVLLTCNHCNKPFLAGAMTSKRTNAYFCSNKCRVAAQRA